MAKDTKQDQDQDQNQDQHKPSTRPRPAPKRKRTKTKKAKHRYRSRQHRLNDPSIPCAKDQSWTEKQGENKKSKKWKEKIQVTFEADTNDDEPDDERTTTLFQSDLSLENTTTEMVHQDGGFKETKDNNGTETNNSA